MDWSADSEVALQQLGKRIKEEADGRALVSDFCQKVERCELLLRKFILLAELPLADVLSSRTVMLCIICLLARIDEQDWSAAFDTLFDDYRLLEQLRHIL